MRKRDLGAVARRHLDSRLNKETPIGSLTKPPSGWIKAIRSSLGMSTYQLADRLSVSQATVAGLEGSEAKGKIQLATLERVAEALNCRLAYALVPNEPLETMVTDRKRTLAKRLLKTIGHTMRLEDQAVDDSAVLQREIEAIANDIKPSEVWKVGA